VLRLTAMQIVLLCAAVAIMLQLVLISLQLRPRKRRPRARVPRPQAPAGRGAIPWRHGAQYLDQMVALSWPPT
jgi:hypothetical protein